MIKDLRCRPPYTSTQPACLHAAQRPLSPRGHTHTRWISPTQDDSIPQMCQSNCRLMLLCIETDTLGYKGTLACVHNETHTRITVHPSEIWTLLFSRGFSQLKGVWHVDLFEGRQADPSHRDIFSKWSGCMLITQTHCMRVSVRMHVVLSFWRINGGTACSILSDRGQVSEFEAVGAGDRGERERGRQFPC